MRTPASDVRRRELANEAAAVFDRDGFHNTSVEDIAAAVGLGKATLYHYFTSKHEILFWIHEDFIERMIGRQEARLESPMPAKQMLLAIMEDLLEPAEDRRGQGRVFFEHYAELPDEFAVPIAKKRDRYSGMVEDVIKRGIADGSFRDRDPRLVTLAIFGMCNWTYRWYRAGGPLLPRDVAYSFWELVTSGLDESFAVLDGGAGAAAQRSS
jgi:AcrR family transcriptional regulator